MQDWLTHTLQVGGLYAALAVGFCLYFGAMRLINLAHGDVFTVGAFAALLCHELFGPLDGVGGLLILLVISTATGLMLGPVIELVAYRRIRGREPYILLLTSVAVSIVLREGLALLYPNGANPHPFPDPLPNTISFIGGLQMRASATLAVGLLLASAVGLVLFVRRTRVGRKLLAVSQDPIAAAMIGINVDRIMIFAFAVASALACAGGCLYGTIYGVVKYDMGLLLGLRGFAAAAIGGMHRIEGGILGGFLLAAVELGVARVLPGGSGYRDVVVFALLILVLAIRPQGILGKSRRDIDTAITRRSDGKVSL